MIIGLLKSSGEEIYQFTVDIDPSVYFPKPLWVAGSVIAFDGGRGTRLLLTRSSK